MAAAGKLDAIMFTSSGPAGILALYAPPGAHLGLTFLNEFVCDWNGYQSGGGSGNVEAPVQIRSRLKVNKVCKRLS